MVFKDRLCLCSGLPCPAASSLPEGRTSERGWIRQDVPEPKSSLAPSAAAAAPAEVQCKASHEAQTPVGFKLVCMRTILWLERVRGHLYRKRKTCLGSFLVIATPWCDVVSLFYFSLSDPPPGCHLSGKTPSLPGPECKCLIFLPPTGPLCSTGHLAVIFQHLKAIIPKYECSITDVSRHSKDFFSFIFLSASWAKKEEKSRCLVSWSTHMQHVCMDVCKNSLIPNDMTLSVQVHAQKAHTHTPSVYFTRTHHKECKMILH